MTKILPLTGFILSSLNFDEDDASLLSLGTICCRDLITFLKTLNKVRRSINHSLTAMQVDACNLHISLWTGANLFCISPPTLIRSRRVQGEWMWRFSRRGHRSAAQLSAAALVENKGTKQASLISLLNESETKRGGTQTHRLGHTQDKLITQERGEGEGDTGKKTEACI